MQPYILVMEDEDALATLLQYNLEKEGYDVTVAADGEEGMLQIDERQPDLVLLDWMLPKLSGIEVCRRIRGKAETRNLPIIMLTAKASEIDRVLGLEFGADDYVTKPFSPRELMLRVRNLLKRKESSKEEVERFQVRDIELDVSKYEVKIMGQPIDLTPTEFKLLQILMERKGRVQSRDRLLQDVWGYDQLIDTRTVDTHVRRLREKMGEAADYVTTVRGVGYRLMEPAG